MMNKRKLTSAAAAGIVCLLVVAGCGSSELNEETVNSTSRQVIEKPDKTITIIDSEPVAASEVEVVKIDKLEGVRGMDWLGEDKLIIDKLNKNMEPVTIEGEQRYPHNLYIRDSNAGQASDEALQEESHDQGFGMLSPDKKYLFYKKHEENTARGFIMDLATRKSAPMGDLLMGASDGEWRDNESVIFPSFSGNIYSSDVNGNVQLLAKTKKSINYNVKQVGTKVYYISTNNQLTVYDTATKETTTLDKGVTWFIPSPDGQQYALVKRVTETEMELKLLDAELKPKQTIAKSTQVYGTSWSPDGSKLAYNAISEDGGVKGIFVADAVSGKTTQISVDVQYASDELRWSPSGKKLMTSTSVMQENSSYSFVTYLISLK
ncbi:hypothetical protein K0T92_06390 [Paenibacillus oenotherae]|uniref:TolB protein n=1 Tax=Paenibacillus oenotherae TaxID=1435645 RepID=A0ABS7D359_9BACL|nr:hypothetical protein [Paenibacillus oenotherae]MBW7474367.1 hypothetical protein [Paenibacillus oenotherae]